PDSQRVVALAQLAEAVLEERHRTLRLADGRVAATEGRVDVRARLGRHRGRGRRVLQMRHRLPVLALSGERQAEPDPRSKDGGLVGGLVRLAEERAERVRDRGVAALEPERELRVAEPKVAT